MNSKLPSGYAKIIAEKLDISINIVYNVAYGRTKNYKVMYEINKLVEENLKFKKLCEEKMNLAYK